MSLAVDPSRCSHQRIARSRCEACIDACPRGAWSIDGDGLTLDNDACDDCGQCVAVCPQEALSIPAPIPLVHGQSRRCITLACARVAPEANTAVAGVVECLHGLSPEWLLQQARQHGSARVQLACENCEQCDRFPHGATLAQRWESVARRLGARMPGLEWITPRQWTATAGRTDAPDPARRRFFGGALTRPATLLKLGGARPGQALTSGRHDLVNRLANEPGSNPMWTIAIDVPRCSACMACVRLCPEHALEHDTHAGSPLSEEALRLHPQRCIGCRLCEDVCDDDAISIASPLWPDVEQVGHVKQTLPLSAHTCTACKQTFRRLISPMNDNTETASICPICQRGKLLHTQRIVQQTNPDQPRLQ